MTYPNDTTRGRTHRFTVKMVDGQLELDVGVAIPLAEGAEAEIRIAERHITDHALVAKLNEVKPFKVFPAGTELVAMLSGAELNEVPEAFRSAYLPDDFGRYELGLWFERWHRNSNRKFVRMTIGPGPTGLLPAMDEHQSGLWFLVRGRRVEGMRSSPIKLPDCIPDGPASSVNHAYTLLSQTLEPWRKAHTGNVYEQVLYKEGNGRWYPLSFLRENRELEEGQTVAKDHWDRFLMDMKQRSSR